VKSPIRMMFAFAFAVCALLAAATQASASRDQKTILQDDAQLIGSDGSRRDATLDEWKALGVDIVKVRVDWRDTAPATKPADPTDPAAYDPTDWALYDAVVRGARQRGMDVYLMLGGHAPAWASQPSPKGLPSGVHRPDPALFGQFVQAVGKRYSGTYTPQDGDYFDPNPLPRVTIWSVWNEPNLVSWLSPQADAPEIYRKLLYAGFDGLSATGHGNDILLYGEFVPFGASKGKRRRPLEFLREVACVNSSYRAYTGSSARKRGCNNFRALPGTGVAHHPYTFAGGPSVKMANRDDVSIGQLSRMTSALDKLTRKKRFAASGKQALWSTEFGIQSDPPDPVQTPIKKVPEYLGQAEWIAFKNSRVSAWSQYPFTDDPVAKSGPNRHAGFQSGIRFENGREKTGVYHAFRFPFYVRRLSGSKVEVFGGVRGAAQGAQVTIESRSSRRGKWKSLTQLTTGAQGYFDRNFSVSNAATREFRFQWQAEKSRTARAKS
jgi:hypothetical protein